MKSFLEDTPRESFLQYHRTVIALKNASASIPRCIIEKGLSGK